MQYDRLSATIHFMHGDRQIPDVGTRAHFITRRYTARQQPAGSAFKRRRQTDAERTPELRRSVVGDKTPRVGLAKSGSQLPQPSDVASACRAARDAVEQRVTRLTQSTRGVLLCRCRSRLRKKEEKEVY